MQWTGYNAYVTVGSIMTNQTCGLCGTFNHNKGDDFHTHSNAVETSVEAFTRDWIYKGKQTFINALESSRFSKMKKNTAKCYKMTPTVTNLNHVDGNFLFFVKK